MSTLTCYPGKELANNYSLNTVDICPVGALTSTDFRFKMRVWFLKRTNSICTESSVGANTEVWSREGKIYRVTPRRNDAVNDTWMTDSGRALYKQVESEDRLAAYTVDGVRKSIDDAVAAAVELLKGGDVGLVASAHSSVEEQFFHKALAERTGASVAIVGHTREGDGILLSEDRTPNLRGALLNGLISEIPPASLEATAREINSGAIKTLVVVNEDVTGLGIPEETLAKVNLIHIGSHANATSRKAKVVIPALTVFEKSGSFVNQNFRLQKFHPAIPGPSGVVASFDVLEQIAAPLAAEKPERLNIDTLWQRLAAKVPQFAGLGWRSIPDEGVELEAGNYADLPFVETKNLKYDPEARRAAPEPAGV